MTLEFANPRWAPIGARTELAPSAADDGTPADTLHTAPVIVVLIPAYDEDRFIGSVVLKAREFAGAVVVVDDGSRDDTVAVARAAGAMVLRHEVNRGKGDALSTGVQCIRELWPEAIVVMLDADGQHHPQHIPTLVRPIQEGQAHIVVGSRFLNVHSNIPGWRKWGQSALTSATNLLSGYRLTDSQSGFRAFAPNILRELRFRQGGFSVESEMQFIAREHGWTMAEVPIEVTYAERAKRNPVTHGMQVLNGILRLTGQVRPLLFFGVSGSVLFVTGLSLGGHVIAIYDSTHTLAVGYALITVMLSIIGVLTLFTGIMLHSIRALFLQFSRYGS